MCGKSENRFEILKDEDDVIDWHILCDNVTPMFVAVLSYHRKKYRREYYFRFKLAPLIKYEQKCYHRRMGVIYTHPSKPFVHLDMGEWVRV